MVQQGGAGNRGQRLCQGEEGAASAPSRILRDRLTVGDWSVWGLCSRGEGTAEEGRAGTHRSLRGKGWPTDVRAEGLHWLFGGNPEVSGAPSGMILQASWEGRPRVAGWRLPSGNAFETSAGQKMEQRRTEGGVQPITCFLHMKEPWEASWRRPRGTQPPPP